MCGFIINVDVFGQDYFKKGVDSGWDHRKLSWILTERAKSRSVASSTSRTLSNWCISLSGSPTRLQARVSHQGDGQLSLNLFYHFCRIQERYLPTKLSALIEQDSAAFEEEQKRKEAETLAKEQEGETVTTTVITTTTTTTVVKKKSEGSTAKVGVADANGDADLDSTSTLADDRPNAPQLERLETCLVDSGHVGNSPLPQFPPLPPQAPQPSDNNLPSNAIEIMEDENSVYLGLRVYTHKDTPIVIVGRLKAEMDRSDERPLSPVPL